MIVILWLQLWLLLIGNFDLCLSLKSCFVLLSGWMAWLKECNSSFDHQEWEMAFDGGISAKFRLFYAGGIIHVLTSFFFFFFGWKSSQVLPLRSIVQIYIFFGYINFNHLYNSKIVLNGSILLRYNLIYYTWASTCILTEFVKANFRFFLNEINHCPWLCI